MANVEKDNAKKGSGIAAKSAKGVWVTSRVLIAILVMVFSLGYFIPTGVAILKGRKNTLAIFVLNIFAFTVILWVVALVWAVKSDKDTTIIIQQSKE